MISKYIKYKFQKDEQFMKVDESGKTIYLRSQAGFQPVSREEGEEGAESCLVHLLIW